MKVFVDKLQDGKEHVLSVSELKSLHRFLAPRLKFWANSYRLSSQPAGKSRFDRPVKYDSLSRKVTICLVDLSKEEMITEIFIEALQVNDHSLHAATSNHLTRSQLKIATEKASGLYKEYESSMRANDA